MPTKTDLAIIGPLIRLECEQWMCKTLTQWEKVGHNIVEPHGLKHGKNNFNWKMEPIDDNPLFGKHDRYIAAFQGAYAKNHLWQHINQRINQYRI